MLASQPRTLKVDFEGEVRRLRGWPEDGVEPSLPSLQAAVGELFGLSRAAAEALYIKYRDEEGDLCTLQETTMPDATAMLSEPPHTLRLIAVQRAAPAAGGPEQELAESHVASTASVAAVSAFRDAVASEDSGAPGARDAPDVARTQQQQQQLRREQQLRAGLFRFGRMVASDFSRARDDAWDAFRPKGPASRPDGARVVDTVAVVPATLIGACVAARLAPVRLMRMTVHSVAVAAGRNVPVELDTVESAEDAPRPAEHDAQGELVAGHADVPAGLAAEFKHFVKQVAQDFKSAKADVKAAVTCIVGTEASGASLQTTEENGQGEQSAPAPQRSQQDAEGDSSGQVSELRPEEPAQPAPAEERPSQPPQQLWTARRAVPAAASTVAGAMVASTLAPVRLVRLAIASVAVAASAAASSRTEVAAEASPAPSEQELAASDEEAAPVATSAQPLATSAGLEARPEPAALEELGAGAVAAEWEASPKSAVYEKVAAAAAAVEPEEEDGDEEEAIFVTSGESAEASPKPAALEELGAALAAAERAAPEEEDAQEEEEEEEEEGQEEEAEATFGAPREPGFETPVQPWDDVDAFTVGAPAGSVSVPPVVQEDDALSEGESIASSLEIVASVHSSDYELC